MLAADALVLFDVDGTLIRPQSGTQGMLDRDILTVMLRNAGASRAVIREKMPEIVRHAKIFTRGRVQTSKTKVCPGVRMLLRRLNRRAVPAGLVLGNLTRIGWKKMEHAGLKEFFQFGAFGPGSASLCNVRGAKA